MNQLLKAEEEQREEGDRAGSSGMRGEGSEDVDDGDAAGYLFPPLERGLGGEARREESEAALRRRALAPLSEYGKGDSFKGACGKAASGSGGVESKPQLTSELKKALTTILKGVTQVPSHVTCLTRTAALRHTSAAH